MDNSAAPVARKMCRGCRTEKDIGQFHDLRGNGKVNAILSVAHATNPPPEENPPRKFDEPGPRFTGDDQETPLLAEDMATKREFDEALAAEKMQRCLRCKERWFDIKLMADGGITLDKAVCDISAPEFASGLSYVAVSRVKTLGGLMFERPFDRSRVYRETPSRAMGLKLLDHATRRLQALDVVAGVDPSEELSQVDGVAGRRTDIGASSLPYSTLTRIVLRRGTGKLPGAGERKEAPRSVAKGRATDERSDASNFTASLLVSVGSGEAVEGSKVVPLDARESLSRRSLARDDLNCFNF
ncbi:predicted protein [Chaetomium globosum CBS 148.51]|uniref:Uncharacterized protein n=1 Tax=Chaetomium globosum (strain ATCC 6205 / CBS 148.51 / DSM 1962 / NBRC 6347 / NRRL 1970) TaxID=306901 RepID=Q2H888_CHAGB|nr:uncharacterized protein CHGG_03566 [Chaetomium globosum CBS 148.51]EAQ91631.1 predicted protein [Chaetomium globosum CBS 148.51]